MTRPIPSDSKPTLQFRADRTPPEAWELRLGEETVEIVAGGQRLAEIARRDLPEQLRLSSAATGLVTLALPVSAGDPEPVRGRLSPRHLKCFFVWLGPASSRYIPRAWRSLTWFVLAISALVGGCMAAFRLVGAEPVTDLDSFVVIAGALVFGISLLVLFRPMPWFALLELVPVASFIIIDIVWLVRYQFLGWWIAVALQVGLLAVLGWRFRNAHLVYQGIRSGIDGGTPAALGPMPIR